jgi:hypothetical protein
MFLFPPLGILTCSGLDYQGRDQHWWTLHDLSHGRRFAFSLINRAFPIFAHNYELARAVIQGTLRYKTVTTWCLLRNSPGTAGRATVSALIARVRDRAVVGFRRPGC